MLKVWPEAAWVLQVWLEAIAQAAELEQLQEMQGFGVEQTTLAMLFPLGHPVALY